VNQQNVESLLTDHGFKLATAFKVEEQRIVQDRKREKAARLAADSPDRKGMWKLGVV